MKSVPSSWWMERAWKDLGSGNRTEARTREERLFSECTSFYSLAQNVGFPYQKNKKTKYILKVHPDERGTRDEIQTVTNSFT